MHFSDESRLGRTFIWGLFTLGICIRSIDVTISTKRKSMVKPAVPAYCGLWSTGDQENEISTMSHA